MLRQKDVEFSARECYSREMRPPPQKKKKKEERREGMGKEEKRK